MPADSTSELLPAETDESPVARRDSLALRHSRHAP